MLILPESIQTLINAFVAIFAKKEELKQPDWNQSDYTKLDYIKNKPSIPSIDGLASTTYVDNAVGAKVDKINGKGLSTNDYTTAEKEKLSALNKGVANGVAELDENGRVPSSQLPSYVDDVLEYSSQSAFPAAGESGKIYVDHSTNKTYRWSGYNYVEISASLAIGTTATTAFRGDLGKEAYDHSQIKTGNPHRTTKADLGLGNVENKSSETIRGELTKANVTAALGYTPPTSDTNTTYSAGTGISLSGTTFSNSGVRSIATGTANGTISVNTDGTTVNVVVKGLGSAAYTNSTAYMSVGQTIDGGAW